MFERTWTVAFSNSGSPGAVLVDNVNLPYTRTGKFELAAWRAGAITQPNTYGYNMAIVLFEGVRLSDDINTQFSNGEMDALMCLPAGGIGSVLVSNDLESRLTLWTPQEVQQIATLRVRELR